MNTTPTPKKRTFDGLVKDEQSEDLSALMQSLQLQQSRGTERAAQARLSMEVDVLQRRIATVQSYERGRDVQKATSEQSKPTRSKAPQTEDPLLDWGEEVLR